MGEIAVVPSSDRRVADADTTWGVTREEAFASDNAWVGFVHAAPQRPSGWHHHGDHDTYFYIDTGALRMEFGPDGSKSVEAGPGDFVYVPKQTIHREVNPGTVEARVILVRMGSGPPVVNVDGPES